ncbi:MAG TPA: hypothetical protein VK034_30370 [Enhygromyxa sp.]|nr:hypothetical protein [Enhygromyxa sp.]
MPCITANTTLPVETLDDGATTIYFVVVSSTTPVTIVFSCDGTITSVTNNPSPPRATNNSITFTAAHIGQTFTTTVEYTESGEHQSGDHVNPLETPTKLPKFKPVTSCPS